MNRPNGELKLICKLPKASNLAKSSEELPEIVTKRVNLNERLAQEARKETGVDCEAAELNSLAIENRPYYSSKLPMSPKIVTNRGCIKVNGKSFWFNTDNPKKLDPTLVSATELEYRDASLCSTLSCKRSHLLVKFTSSYF